MTRSPFVGTLVTKPHRYLINQVRGAFVIPGLHWDARPTSGPPLHDAHLPGSMHARPAMGTTGKAQWTQPRRGAGADLKKSALCSDALDRYATA